MRRIAGALRGTWRWVRGVVSQIRSGEDDMRDLYGENPNHVSDRERNLRSGLNGS